MKALTLKTPTDTSIHIFREIDAPLELVWRAYTEPELVKQWMTGPPDHSMPTCEIDFRVGGQGHYVWKNPEFEMGMTAEFLEIVDRERIVHTENYEGWPEGQSTLTASFRAIGDRTEIDIHIQYKTQEARDAALQPGFEEGYEASYKTLEVMLQRMGISA
ncbi:hypothetical protein KR51_00028490 [Rubidibacter lacunae KORDI 51-2]|uniref:Activator of Hsp90 ATPase homologue 1/2-like C-terminal domain-containing protein n=1 Tax=Rubidibacter lacunae KORDI 51-2 TaxID=582515 RepID=U5DI35_9CHRO|nr:SRPBCC domain-containing protein [Rubidibacter lacunae]ERN40592.1 hypothetical protein KR51_00028490 [Rubidibacter lacunae KORDI 51-2]